MAGPGKLSIPLLLNEKSTVLAGQFRVGERSGGKRRAPNCRPINEGGLVSTVGSGRAPSNIFSAATTESDGWPTDTTKVRCRHYDRHASVNSSFLEEQADAPRMRQLLERFGFRASSAVPLLGKTGLSAAWS